MKRILAYLLLTAMIFTVCPMGVSAEGEQNSTVFSGEPEAAANTAAEPDFNNIDISQNISQTDTVLDVPVEEHKKDGVSNVVLTTAEYEAQMAEMEANGKTQEELAADKEYITLLLRHRLVYKTGYDSLISKMESEPNFKTAIEWLFNDYETLQYYVYGGEPDNWTWDGRTNVATPEIYLKSLGIFSDLYNAHNNDITEEGHPTYDRPVNPDGPDEVEDITLDETKLQNKSLFKRLMVAIALTHSSEICMWNKLSSSNRHVFNLFPKSDPVGRYELYKKLYIHRLLTADFDKYNVDELRMVVSVMIDNTQLEWMNYYYRITFLNDEDYLKEPAEVTEQNVSGWCNMRYTAFCTQPQCMGHGGLGDKYYDDNNREQWTKKYHLKVNDGVVFNFNVPYGPVDQTDKETQDRTLDRNDKYYATRQWIEIEAGSVCFGISNTATVLRCAFGFPTVINEELPNHCAYFEYHHKNITEPVTPNSANLTLGIGYDAYGITSALPYFHRYTLTGWGCYPCSSVRNGIYMVYGMDAIFSRFENTEKAKYSEKIMAGMSDVYLKAFNLRLMGDVQQKIGDEKAKNEESEGSGNSEYEKAIALYNKALTVQDYHFSAFIGLADCYNKFKKSDEEFVNLAKKAAESKMWLYAQPLSDYLINYLVPMMNAADKKADVVFIAEDGLRKAQTLNSNNHGLAQPSYSVAIANYCLATIKKIATFSFESEAITVSADYADLSELQYSLDGGQTWTKAEKSEETPPIADAEETAKPAVYKLSKDTLNNITAANGIRYKFNGGTKDGLITFTTGTQPVSNPSKNTPDDNGNRFLNLEKGLEYSLTENGEWSDLTADVRFQNDNITVYVRRKATGTTLASEQTEVEFTKGEGTPDFSFMNNDNIKDITVDTQPFTNTNIKLAIDGKPGTYFENAYANTRESAVFENGMVVRDKDGKYMPRQAYEFILSLKNPRYISGLKYQAKDTTTAITGLNVYASVDGKVWTFVDSVDDWEQSAEEQTLKFDNPAYAKYIKILTTKVPSQPHLADASLGNLAHFTVAELKLYENYEVIDKTPMALTAAVESDFKSEYQIGDKPDLEKIEARLEYEDGTYSIIPTSALECDVNIFTSTETNKLNFTYEGLSASVDVTVINSNRTPEEIKSITARDRKYYENDAVDNRDVEVAVSNESETWYLLPDQFSIEGTLTAGPNELTVNVLDTELTGTINITADNAVNGITIEKPEDFKVQYFIGDTLDISGMTVKLNYENGTDRALKEGEYTIDMYMEKVPEEAEGSPEPAALEESGDEKIVVPVDIDDFGKTPGTVNLRVTLNDKAEICAEEEFTVLSYITNGEFSFNVNSDNTCTLTEYKPSGENYGKTVTVPEQAEINGLTFPVTEIAANAFENAVDMEAVSLPKTVQMINSNAFASCRNLKNIYMIYHDDLTNFDCEQDAFVGSGTLYLNSALAAQYVEKESPISGYKVEDLSKKVEEIDLVPPTKTEYILNENLDTTGMVVTAVLNDKSRVETQNYTVSYTKDVVNEKVPVTVKINDTEISKTFDIKIDFPEVKIIKQPENGAYRTNTPIEPLTVEAVADFDNTVKYQWYTCSDENGGDAQAINGANTNTYNPEQASYYYAEAYVEDADGNTSDKARSEIVQVAVKDYAIIAGGKGYDTLKEALEETQTDCTVTLYADVTVNDMINVPGKKHIILEGNGHTVKRGSGASKQMLILKQKSDLTLSNVIIDGGAIWDDSTIDPILNRGTRNKGLSVQSPMIEAFEQASLVLTDGAVLQNNHNTEMNGYPAYPATGAVKLWGASITIENGIIRNNHSENNASAIYLTNSNGFSSSLKMKSGEICGNFTGYWAYVGGSAISVMGNSTAQITGGKFHNNKSHEEPSRFNNSICQGGVFTVTSGTLSISGGEFYNNSVGGIDNEKSQNIGGAIGCSGGTTTISGGTFTNNTGRYGGAVGVTGGAVTISGGTFTNNNAELGGAFYSNSSGGTLNIIDAQIKNNKAENGSAVYINRASSLNLSGDTFEDNTAAKDGTVWSKGPVGISNLSFINNQAEKGSAIYTDYTDFNQNEGIRISSLTDNMQEIYMKRFMPIHVYGNLQGKAFEINTETKIDDSTEVLTLLGIGTDDWDIQGTINNRALTVNENGTVKRKPFEGMKLSPLPGAVEEHGETFDQGFTTDVVDPSGCKSLIMTFGGEEGLTVKYPIGKLFDGVLEQMAGDIRFGLIINDIPKAYKGNVGIKFSEDEPNQPNPDSPDAESTPEAETGFETEPAPTEDSVIIE